MMKKILLFLCLLSLAALAGCAGTTTFSDFQVEETDTALEAAGTVSLRGQEGVVLTIQALEPFSTTLHLTYSKEVGAVSVVLDDAQEVSLEAGAAEDSVTDLPVSLAEGRMTSPFPARTAKWTILLSWTCRTLLWWRVSAPEPPVSFCQLLFLTEAAFPPYNKGRF